jgi:hypothetical protein
MLHSVALVITDVSEELSVFSIRVTRIGELGTMLAVTSNCRMLRRNTWPDIGSNLGHISSHTLLSLPSHTHTHTHTTHTHTRRN